MSNLGRFQHGDRVAVDVVTPTLPDDHPVAAVMTSGGSSIGAFRMARNPDAGGFRVVLQLGPQYGLGTYTVSVTYTVAGVGQSASSAFEVVAGGDQGVPVISLYS